MRAEERFAEFHASIENTKEPVLRGFGTPPRFLYVRPVMDCTGQDILSLTRAISGSDEFAPDLPTLWDFRGHGFADCTAETCRTLAYSLKRFMSPSAVQRGILVDSDHGFGTGRMFQQIAQGYAPEQERHFLVTYSVAELIDWLTKPV